MIPNAWTIEPLSGALGAEVRGVNLATLDDSGFAALQKLLLEHLVLFLPDQSMSLTEHVALGERFGPIADHPNLKNPFTEHPGVFELAASQGGIADEWHTDITFEPEPAVLSILRMVACPDTGGDTMWSNLYKAFDELSAPMRDMCMELSALHDAQPHDRADKMAIHPVVRVHPETGKRALYVNEHFTRRIVELNAAESASVLGFLTAWVANPRFTVRYRWAPQTVAIWDNRCTQHFVVNDFVGERVIQRVTVMGDKPDAPPRTRNYPPAVGAARTAMSRHDRQLIRFLKANGSDLIADSAG